MEKKTKSITVTKFDYIIRHGYDEELDSNGHPNHFSEFDTAGRPLTEIRYNPYGEFEEKIEYAYDERGFMLSESYYPTESEVAEVKTFVRNEDGSVARALKRYQDGSVDTIAYEYNGEGQLIKMVTTTDEGEVDQVETFEWEHGEIVSRQVVDGQGDLISEPDYADLEKATPRITRNDKGQVVREEETDEDGEVYFAVNRSYDEEGNPDEVDVFIDGRGRSVTRHYFLKYQYTFYE